ncbi:hypothetical protein BDD12DRAFT_806238 [Trichophaea hybrida]|nr:hypothetical protein BDD12DRAFT_811001 [Trichophaea hybrida]KAF8538314.1 hypothetical protein BDD12DRAFT_806238 [Trichophaea hybrida]
MATSQASPQNSGISQNTSKYQFQENYIGIVWVNAGTVGMAGTAVQMTDCDRILVSTVVQQSLQPPYSKSYNSGAVSKKHKRPTTSMVWTDQDTGMVNGNKVAVNGIDMWACALVRTELHNTNIESVVEYHRAHLSV